MKTNSNPYFHIRVPWTFKLYPQLDVKVTETQISFPCSALQNTAHQPPEGWGKPFTLLSNLQFLLEGFQQPLCRTCNRTATPTGLFEVSSALRADLYPYPVPLQWTRNSFVVAAGWIGLSTGQEQQALHSCLRQAATCLHTQVHRDILKKTSTVKHSVYVWWFLKKCGTNAGRHLPAQQGWMCASRETLTK